MWYFFNVKDELICNNLFCEGILIGILIMEMGGKVIISCFKISYRVEVEFKFKVRFLF